MIYAARQYIAYAMTDYVCPFVGLSDTVQYHVKLTQATIMEDSPMNVVFSLVNFTAKFQREHRERGRRVTRSERGVGKIRNFQPISSRISETVRDRTMVTMTD